MYVYREGPHAARTGYANGVGNLLTALKKFSMPETLSVAFASADAASPTKAPRIPMPDGWWRKPSECAAAEPLS